MKFKWKSELVQWVIIAAMFALALMSRSLQAANWNFHVPPSITFSPTEGLSLNPFDTLKQQAEKYSVLYTTPAISLLVYLFLYFLPFVDPGRANYAQFRGAYDTFRIALISLLGAVYGAIHLQLRGYPIDAATVAAALVGVLFVVWGNLLGKVRPNWFMGIRTPWTLSSKISWNKTNRVGGMLMILMGLVQILGAALLGSRSLNFNLPSVVALAAVTVVYSYFVWRSDPDKIPPLGVVPAEGPLL